MPKMAHPTEKPSGYSHYRFRGFPANNGGVICRAREKLRIFTEMAGGRAQWTGGMELTHANRTPWHAEAMGRFISESVVGIPTV